jgi:hypothetical protein
MKRKKVEEFVRFQLLSMDYATEVQHINNADYSLPFHNSYSVEMFELVRRCEEKFCISIPINDIKHDWNTDMFVDYVFNKLK